MECCDPFSEWLKQHEHLIPYLTFSDDGCHDKDFKSKRNNIHQNIIKTLNRFKEKSMKKKSLAEKNLDMLASIEIPEVPYLCYDNKDDIMYIRKFTAVRQKLRKRQIELVTNLYGIYQDNIQNVNDLMELIKLIPENQCLCVDNSLMIFKNEKTEKYKKTGIYLIQCVNRMKNNILAMEKAPWEKDFNGYFKHLINEATPRFLNDISYLFPMENEISLSRCFFCYKSRFITVIDEIVDQIQTVKLKEFASILINFCINSIPNRFMLSPAEQSVALLMLYRCVFHRCYEKYPHIFAPKFDEYPYKIWKMSELPSKLFHLPEKYIFNNDPEQSIRNLFKNNQYYYSASLFLYQSIYCSNPLDSLYNVHKSLVMIHKAAIINEKGKNLASFEDIKQMICFDDLFSLFFGTLMCSEHPDIFYTYWLTSSFLENSSLSPPFEYASTNLEGIISHCRNFNIDEFKQRLTCK